MNRFTESIWGDEGFSAILSMKPLPEIIRIIARDTSPPLWNIWEWLFFRLFGTSEIVIRALAFTFFLGAIFFTYQIGKLLWNKKTGILAAVLTFLNPFFFIYAFEGRMYSILALGVAASMYFFLKITLHSKENPFLNRAGYIIATLWAMYSHHFAIFAVILQGLWFLYELFKGDKKIASSLFRAFIAVGIGYLPWMIPLYNQTKMVGGGFWLGTPTIKEFFGLIIRYLGAGIDHPARNYAVILILLTLSFRRLSLKKSKDIFLLSWFLFPIAATWVISQFFQSIFFDRYLLYTIPGAMLILSSNRRKLSLILATALIIVLLIIDLHYFTHPTKRPFRQLANYVKQTQEEGDFLINWNAASHHLWETKYYQIPAPIYIPDKGELPFFVGTALMQKGDVIYDLPEGIKRVGVVTSGSVDEISLPGYTGEKEKIFQAPGGVDIKFVWYRRE